MAALTSNAVSIDRTSLTLSALLISDDGSGTYSLTDKGLGRPGVSPLTTYAGTSRWLNGNTPISSVRENSTLPLQVLVQAASTAALTAAITALDAALWQFTYNTTTAHDGKVWACHAAGWNVASGVVLHAHWSAFFEVLDIVIPVYPGA